MPNKVFVDSSAWIAYFVPTQPDHLGFKKLFSQLITNHAFFHTSNDIIDESYTRLRYDLGYHVANKFIINTKKSLLNKSLIQLWTDENIQFEAFNLLDKYQDHDLSLTDATTAILMKRFQINSILTLDFKHFTTLGFEVYPHK